MLMLFEEEKIKMKRDEAKIKTKKSFQSEGGGGVIERLTGWRAFLTQKKKKDAFNPKK